MKQPLQETASLLFRNEQAVTTHGSLTSGEKKRKINIKADLKSSCSLLIHLELNYGAQESGLPFERKYFEIANIFF